MNKDSKREFVFTNYQKADIEIKDFKKEILFWADLNFNKEDEL